MIVSPQIGSMQLVRHIESGSFELRPPRSHCSVTASMIVLPQSSSDLQSDEQPSPLTVLLSSQTSPRAASITLLPHTSSDLQSPAQPSPLAVLPSSQTSPPSASTTLLPQNSVDRQ